MRAKLTGRLVAALVGIVALAMPNVAQADHRESHWGHGFRPYVSADCANAGGRLCDFTAYAEDKWNTNNYPNGFHTGNPYQGCGPISGWITTCAVTAATVHSISGCATADACTVKTYVYDPNRHIQSSRIYLCSSCGSATGGNYTGPELRVLMTHEYGHAIAFTGTPHTSAAGSVMRAVPAVPSYPVEHDRVAMTNEYGHVDP